MAGVTLNDKRLAAEVRTLTLNQIKRALNGDDEAFKKALLLKLAPTVLPRINEHTGEDGSAINVNIVKYGDNPAVQLPTETVPDTSVESAG